MIKGIFERHFLSSKFNYCQHDSKCGMRNPTSRQKDDDLSRLTSTSTSSSNDRSNANYPLVDSDSNSNEFNSNYLPQVIDPIEWQQKSSRKRKERQDSTSSITQDRKLVRSNSEEYLPNNDYEVIRRVLSHENVKAAIDDIDQCPTDKENESPMLDNRHARRDDISHMEKSTKNEVQEILKEAHRRTETSPARSRTFDFSHKLRISPVRDSINYARRDDNDSDSERRRSSERSCKARAVQSSTRKTISNNKKSSNTAAFTRQSNAPQIDPNNQESDYKYDLNAMKSERRGFKTCKGNANNIIVEQSCDDVDDVDDVLPYQFDQNDNETRPMLEDVPWHRLQEDDETPVISERFAENKFEHVSHDNAAKMSDESLPSIAIDHLIKSDLMKNVPMMKLYTSPDEKLNQINKRLTALKKRLVMFEDNFEKENGYRPSPNVKLNDKNMKNTIAEIHKLRKEKQALKVDPMMAFKISQSGDRGQSKAGKMRETILEIEKRLQSKRDQDDRSSMLDELNAEQLVQEKSSVQRALLYLESLYGRPNTRDERDIARPLYDRYRTIKRLVNRSASIIAAGTGNLSELPTILENEAMAFTVADASLTPLPNDSDTNLSWCARIDSPIDPSSSIVSSTDSTDTSSSINENIGEMSLEELSHNLDVVREEKRQLRRTIKEFEQVFEEQNGRKMLKADRIMIEETYGKYKQKKAKLRLLDALLRKQMSK